MSVFLSKRRMSQISKRACAACEKSGGDIKFKMCSACKKVWYCSKECQRSDWKTHKVKCKKARSSEQGQEQKTKKTFHEWVPRFQRQDLPEKFVDVDKLIMKIQKDLKSEKIDRKTLMKRIGFDSGISFNSKMHPEELEVLNDKYENWRRPKDLEIADVVDRCEVQNKFFLSYSGSPEWSPVKETSDSEESVKRFSVSPWTVRQFTHRLSTFMCYILIICR